jgi:hypothetical protein
MDQLDNNITIFELLTEFNFFELMRGMAADEVLRQALIDFALDRKDKDWFMALTGEYWREMILAEEIEK